MPDNAIAAEVNPNAGFDRLNAVIGLKGGLLGLEAKRQALQGQAADVQQRQMDAEAQAGTRDFFTNWSPGDHIAADGTTDIESAHGSPAYKGLSGLARTAVDQKLIQIKQGQIQNASSLLGLNRDQLGVGGQVLGAIAQDPDVIAGNENGKAKVQSALSQWAQIGGPAGAKVAQIYSGITNGDIKKGELPLRIQALQKAALNADRQLQITQPGGGAVQTEAGVQQINTNPYAAQPVGSTLGQPSRNVPAPALMVGPNGQIISVPAGGRGLPGPGGGGGTAPAAAQPTAKLQPLQRPAPNAPEADQKNYNAQIAAGGQHVQDVSSVANDPKTGVQATRFNNQQIIDLLPHASTGPGLRMLNTIASRLPGATGDAYQDIEHYTALNSAALARTMGVPHTNLGAETGAAAAGNVERNPGALAEITKTNDALNTAFDLYNRGLQKVSNSGSDPSRVNAYKQAFGSALDINAMRWADAHRRGDNAEQARIERSVGKGGVAAFQQKLRTLKALAETGDMP